MFQEINHGFLKWKLLILVDHLSNCFLEIVQYLQKHSSFKNIE